MPPTLLAKIRPAAAYAAKHPGKSWCCVDLELAPDLSKELDVLAGEMRAKFGLNEAEAREAVVTALVATKPQPAAHRP